MIDVRLTLTGSTPLVMHNVQLADKENHWAKLIAQITGKRKKTPADDFEVGHLEFLGSLYWESDIGLHIPTWNIIACFGQAATVFRLGKAVFQAVAPTTDRVPLIYEGPRDPEKLWERPEFRFRKSVGVQRAKVTRVRPIFRKWALELDLALEESVLDPEDFSRVVTLAGRSQGLLDARKLGYGRFTAEINAAVPA